MESKNLDRAKQFMPFSPLKGYYEEIRMAQRIKENKKELSDYEAEILSDKILTVKKGDMVKVKYYNIDAYEELEGLISNIDFDFRYLVIVKTKIEFDDILNVEIVS